jgi:hypothetical protein
MPKYSVFQLHLVEHRYIAFQPHDARTVIIVGIFCEHMDIPNRLKELQTLTRHEISAIRREIDPDR